MVAVEHLIVIRGVRRWQHPGAFDTRYLRGSYYVMF